MAKNKAEPASPQTYDGRPDPSAGGKDEDTVVDNTGKGAVADDDFDPASPKTLKNARVRLNAKSYINDVLYAEGAVIDNYSGPAAPHIEVL